MTSLREGRSVVGMDDVATVSIEPTDVVVGCPVAHAPPAATCPFDHTQTEDKPRSRADQRMRRILRIDPDAPRVSLVDAHNAFSRSVAVSAARCTATYVVFPLVGPLIGLSGAVGPVVGLLLSAVSVTAIIISARRFFGSDHPWRWFHAVLGTAIIALLTVSAFLDLLYFATR